MLSVEPLWNHTIPAIPISVTLSVLRHTNTSHINKSQKVQTKFEDDTCDTFTSLSFTSCKTSPIIAPEFPDFTHPATCRHIAALPPEPCAAMEAAETCHGHSSLSHRSPVSKKTAKKRKKKHKKSWKSVSKTAAWCDLWTLEFGVKPSQVDSCSSFSSKLRIASSPPIWSNLSALSCPL